MGQTRAQLPGDGDTAVLMVRLTSDDRRRLKASAARSGRSYGEHIMALVAEHDAAYDRMVHPLDVGARSRR